MNDSGVSVQLCVMLCIALLATSVSAVQISQVVYLPEGSDAGGEAVELYNEQDAPMDIGGWSLRTETSAKDAVVPAGTVLDGRGRFLIADEGWAGARDDLLWRDADHEETITLANENAGVALVDGAGMIIDAIGWGDPAQIGAGLFEGVPFANRSGTGALVRVADTQNNSIDFIAARAALLPGTPVLVEVSAGEVAVAGVVIEDDGVAQGIQWLPVPGRTREMSVEVNVAAGGVAFVVFDGMQYPLMANGSVHRGVVNLSAQARPGEHVLEVRSGSARQEHVVSVLPVKGIAVRSDLMRLSVKSAGSVRVENIGNVEFGVQIAASNLSSGTHVLDAGALKFSPDEQHFFALSEEGQDAGVMVGPGSGQQISIAFDPSWGAPLGTFTGSIRVSAR